MEPESECAGCWLSGREWKECEEREGLGGGLRFTLDIVKEGGLGMDTGRA